MNLTSRLAIIIAALAIPAAAAAKTAAITKTTPAGRTVTVEAITDNILKVTNTAQGETPLPSRASVIADPESGAKVISESGPISVIATPTGLSAMVNDRFPVGR